MAVAALLAGACSSNDGEEAATSAAAAGERISVRWATTDPGSVGYRVASFMVDFLNRELDDGTVVTVHPYSSTTAAMKAVMDGEADIGYTADVGMREYYDGDGPFEGYEPGIGDMVHSFYAYPMESFLMTTAANDGATYGDYDGEPVFFTPAGFMNWLNFSRMFAALGYEFNHTEIDFSSVADALQSGTIGAAGAYTTAGESLPPAWVEAELRTDLAVVKFTDEELAKLDAAGLIPSTVDPTVAFSQELTADEILGVPIRFGYNLRADMSEDLVYNMLKIFEANAEALATLDDGFKPLAADFVGMQVGGVSAVPDIPVHKGMARFLEENGAWDDSWTIAE